MRYGQLPVVVGDMEIPQSEMFFYQYLPIKFSSDISIRVEPRLDKFNDLIGMALCDFVANYGLQRFTDSFVYLTVKNLFVQNGKNYNREGWHSDGFMTDDINYVWSDSFPTEFVSGEFDVVQDDKQSLLEFDKIGGSNKVITYPNNSLIRMDQFVIHRCGEITESKVRQFAKISISKDIYDLVGNSHNYLFDYNWEMRPRGNDRNIPQKLQ